MSPLEIALAIADDFELYTSRIENQTVDGKIQFRAVVDWNGNQWDVSPWAGVTDAHLASIKMLNEVSNKLMAEAQKPPPETDDDCPACGGSGGGGSGAECPSCCGRGTVRVAVYRRPRAVCCSYDGGDGSLSGNTGMYRDLMCIDWTCASTPRHGWL